MAKAFDNTDKLIREIKKASERAITKASEMVKDQAVVNAPVKYGALARSIETDVFERGSQVVGHIGTNSEYAIFVEKGTGEFAENGQGRKTPWSYQGADGKWYTTTGQKPKPYLEPAFDEEKIKKAIRSEYKEVRF